MRWLAGLLLLGASILKAYQLVFDASVLVSSTAERSLKTLQVALEYGLALLVLSGLCWQRLRWVVLALFVGFAGYSLYLALSGATSCGCFGPVKVSPWWTFLIDCAVVLGMLVTSLRMTPSDANIEPPGKAVLLHELAGLIFLTGAIGFVVTLQLSHGQTQDGLLAQAGGLVILEPENWIGQSFPIAPYIGIDLSHGRWTVLLHRHDCAQCQEELPKYEQLAYQEQVALVEVPPFDDAILPSRGQAKYARLRSDHEWFVQTPVEIILENGIVVAASNHHE